MAAKTPHLQSRVFSHFVVQNNNSSQKKAKKAIVKTLRWSIDLESLKNNKHFEPPVSEAVIPYRGNGLLKINRNIDIYLNASYE